MNSKQICGGSHIHSNERAQNAFGHFLYGKTSCVALIFLDMHYGVCVLNVQCLLSMFEFVSKSYAF